MIRGGGRVPALAERGEAGELEPAVCGWVAGLGLEQLVLGAAQDVACDLLEGERILATHLAAPVAEAGCRGLGEVAVLGHVCRVARPRVVEHPRLPRQRRVLADESQPALRLVHQILVAELEVAAPGVPAELPRGKDLRPPPRRELRDGARQRPCLAREALR